MSLLQITTHCSAGCIHCPFNESESWQSVDDVLTAAEDFIAFATLSGGEPLEHPEIHKILHGLRSKQIPFRIATGGHINLRSYKYLFEFENFLGFGIGTDVISDRNHKVEQKKIWWENIALLTNAPIPWSLTITLGSQFDVDSILQQIFRCQSLPSFIMINNINDDKTALDAFKKEWQSQLQARNIPCL